MTSQPFDLIDQTSSKIAVLFVEPSGDRFRGTICLDATPPELKRLFEEFEENVEGQMFDLADDVEEKLATIPLRVVFPNNRDAFIEDLQVFPSMKRVSFRLRQTSSVAR